MFLADRLRFAGGALSAPWSLWDGSKDGSYAAVTGTEPTGTSIALLTANTVIATYVGSGDPTALVGTISGKTITWGAPVVLSAGTYGPNNNTSVIALNSTQAILVFSDSNDVGKPKAVIISVSGTTPSFNTVFIASTEASDWASVDMIDSATAILVYNRTGTTQGRSVILSVSGTTITAPGSIFTFNASTSKFPYVSVISTTQALVVYFDSTNTLLKGQVLSISGTTITGNTAATITGTTNTNFIRLTQLSSTSFIVAVNNSGTSQPVAIVVSVSGTAISNGSTALIYANSVSLNYDRLNICKADSSNFMALYQEDTTGSKMWGIVGTVSGTAATMQTAINLTPSNPTSANHMAAVPLDGQHIVTLFDDLTNTVPKGLVLSTV